MPVPPTVGFNQVLTSGHMTGGRRRELVLLPALLHRLKAIGWSSVVYVAKNATEEQCRLLLQDAPCRLVRTPIPTMPTWKRVLSGINYWKQQVQTDQLSIFHGLYYPLPKLPVKTVFTVHDLRFMHFPDTYTFARRQFLKVVVPQTVRRASRLISVSADTKQDLIRFFDADPEKIFVAFNNIDPSFGKCAFDTEQTILNKYQLRPGYLLYVGTLEPRKNLGRLLSAYNNVRSKLKNAPQLVIVGKPNFSFRETMKAIEDSPYSQDIIFTGFVPDEELPQIYRAAKVLAFPSLHEGFGIPILEAWNAEVACLTSNVSAMPEIAGDACHLVDPYSETSIAEGLTQLVNDDQYCGRLIRAGKERSKEFLVERTVDATLSCYRSLFPE